MSRALILALLAAAIAASQDGAPDDPVRALAAPFDGRVSIYARNLRTGAVYDLNGSSRVNTASTIKVPILIGVYTAVQEGRARWTDASELNARNKVAGSGVLQEMSDGTKVTLHDLVRYMILLSDNTAANLVLDHVPGNDINATLSRLGAGNTRSLRKILKGATPEGVSDAGRNPANAAFGIGVAVPREMVDLLERLYRGEIVSRPASDEILSLMKKQMWRDGMPRSFDAAGVEVADKPGTLDHLRADIGIVYAKSAPVAMAIYCENIPKPDWSPDNPGYLFIAEASGLLVERLTK